MSNQIKIVYLENNVVTNIGIGTTTNGLMGTVVGVATTSSVNVGYAYSNGNFISPYTVVTISTDKKWELIRNRRNSLLSETDWMGNSDVTMTDAWKTYRQALRDLPANTSDPDNPSWPTPPS